MKALPSATAACLLALQLLALPLAASAQQPQPPAGTPGERPHGPPPEAVAACKNLQAAAPCAFTGRRGDVKGTCWAPQGKPLACAPADHPGMNGKAPPPGK